MESWWQQLTTLNKAFAASALFCTTLLIWQLVSMGAGLDGDAGPDVGDGPADHSVDPEQDGGHRGSGAAGFSLVSVRSCVAFGTLFSCAGTLYLMQGTRVALALLYSLAWGVGAMFLVAYLMFRLLKLQEVGNISLWTAVGQKGTVYLNVPPDGFGKVRVMVGGTISVVNARSADSGPMLAGTQITVIDVFNENTVLIKSAEDPERE
jgi:hypothetical protein